MIEIQLTFNPFKWKWVPNIGMAFGVQSYVIEWLGVFIYVEFIW